MLFSPLNKLTISIICVSYEHSHQWLKEIKKKNYLFQKQINGKLQISSLDLKLRVLTTKLVLAPAERREITKKTNILNNFTKLPKISKHPTAFQM